MYDALDMLLFDEAETGERAAPPASASEPAPARPERRRGARHVWFLNSAFDRIDFDVALTRICERDPERPFGFVVTPNVDHLVRLRRDPDFARLYAQAHLTVCDSRVLELIAAMSGERIDVTAGSDLTEALFERVIRPDDAITIVGGSMEQIETLTARYGLNRVAWCDPPMGLRERPEAVAECARFIAANPARFVFLCVGSPQQEMIAEACLERGDCTGLGLCVGASIDFLTGKARRAPVWMRRARLEWLHRLGAAPGRLWRRYLVDGPKIVFLWWEWRRARARLRRLEKRLSKALF